MSEKFIFHPYELKKGRGQRLPERKMLVLVVLQAPEASAPPMLVVGYCRNAAGDLDSPVFTTPGANGKVLGWCDGVEIDEASWLLLYERLEGDPRK